MSPIQSDHTARRRPQQDLIDIFRSVQSRGIQPEDKIETALSFEYVAHGDAANTFDGGQNIDGR